MFEQWHPDEKFELPKRTERLRILARELQVDDVIIQQPVGLFKTVRTPVLAVTKTRSGQVLVEVPTENPYQIHDTVRDTVSWLYEGTDWVNVERAS